VNRFADEAAFVAAGFFTLGAVPEQNAKL